MIIMPPDPLQVTSVDPVGAAESRADDARMLEKKRQVRALKRVLAAKAEVRRLRSLMGRRRVGT